MKNNHNLFENIIVFALDFIKEKEKYPIHIEPIQWIEWIFLIVWSKIIRSKTLSHVRWPCWPKNYLYPMLYEYDHVTLYLTVKSFLHHYIFFIYVCMIYVLFAYIGQLNKLTHRIFGIIKFGEKQTFFSWIQWLQKKIFNH